MPTSIIRFSSLANSRTSLPVTKYRDRFTIGEFWMGISNDKIQISRWRWKNSLQAEHSQIHFFLATIPYLLTYLLTYLANVGTLYERDRCLHYENWYQYDALLVWDISATWLSLICLRIIWIRTESSIVSHPVFHICASAPFHWLCSQYLAQQRGVSHLSMKACSPPLTGRIEDA